MSDFEAAQAWNREIACETLALTNQMLLFRSLLLDFDNLFKHVIKGNNFINDREKICRSLGQLWHETGKSLANFSKRSLCHTFLVYIFMVFLFISIILSMVISLFMWRTIYVIHWGRYGLKQRNPLNIFQITNQNRLFLFIFSLFLFLYQNIYQS